jgi:hypothetical protein
LAPNFQYSQYSGDPAVSGSGVAAANTPPASCP